MWDRLKLGYSVASTGVKVIMGRNDMARAAERDQRSLSSLVEKLLTEGKSGSLSRRSRSRLALMLSPSVAAVLHRRGSPTCRCAGSARRCRRSAALGRATRRGRRTRRAFASANRRPWRLFAKAHYSDSILKTHLYHAESEGHSRPLNHLNRTVTYALGHPSRSGR